MAIVYTKDEIDEQIALINQKINDLKKQMNALEALIKPADTLNDTYMEICKILNNMKIKDSVMANFSTLFVMQELATQMEKAHAKQVKPDGGE